MCMMQPGYRLWIPKNPRIKEVKKTLFEPYSFSNLQLQNRVVLTPLVMRLSTEDGFVTDEAITRYLRIAKGGVGWIILECVVIQPNKSPVNLRLSDDKYIEGLRRLTDAIHNETKTKVGVQVGHFLKASMSGYLQQVEDFTKEEIKEIYEQHIAAAKRLKHCGFDSMEWDAESCMTLSQFLSRKNKRKDEYGGPKLENRQRLLVEIYQGTREILGDDYVLGVRLNGDDFCYGGTTLLHAAQTACDMAKLGINYISVSAGGQWEDSRPTPEGVRPSPYTGYSGLRCWPRAWDPDGTNVHLAEGIRKALRKQNHQIPVITAGKIPTAEFAEEILSEGKADLIGLARPLLCDPNWVKKYIRGKAGDIVTCNYCNHCSDLDIRMEPVVCAKWPKENRLQKQAPEYFFEG